MARDEGSEVGVGRAGLDEDAMDDVDDEPDPKVAIIEMLMAATA